MLSQLGLGFVVIFETYLNVIRLFHTILVKNFMFFLIERRWIYAVNKNFTVFFADDDMLWVVKWGQ